MDDGKKTHGVRNPAIRPPADKPITLHIVRYCSRTIGQPISPGSNTSGTSLNCIFTRLRHASDVEPRSLNRVELRQVGIRDNH